MSSKKQTSLSFQQMKNSVYKFKYALDKVYIGNTGAKNYGAIETYHSFYNELFMKEQNLYEMIYTDHTAVYFDMDKMSFTKPSFDVFIETLIQEVNTHFNIEINKDDVKISVRQEEDENIICSSHVIVDNTCVLQTDIKKLAILLNKKYSCVDTCVYHKYRPFKLPEKTKYGGTKPSYIYNKYDTERKYSEIRKHMINIYDITDQVILKPIIELEEHKTFDSKIIPEINENLTVLNDKNQIFNHLVKYLNQEFYVSKD